MGVDSGWKLRVGGPWVQWVVEEDRLRVGMGTELNLLKNRFGSFAYSLSPPTFTMT